VYFFIIDWIGKIIGFHAVSVAGGVKRLFVDFVAENKLQEARACI